MLARALLDPANLVSLIGLALGACSMLMAAAGRIELSAVLLIWAGAADLADGKVARVYPNSPEVRELGRDLDSLVDACSFGACPVVLLFMAGKMHAPLEVLLLLGYLMAVILRLARFNQTGLIEEGGRMYWQGVPTTYMALLVPALLLVARHSAEPLAWWLPRVGTAGLSLAMVSGFLVPRPRWLTYLTLFGAAVVLSWLWVHQ